MSEALAWLLVLFPLANVYFVWHGWHLFRGDPGRSLVLFGIAVAKTLVWLVGLGFGYYAFRFVKDIQPVLPWNGLGLIVLLILVNLVPLVLHLTLRAYRQSD